MVRALLEGRKTQTRRIVKRTALKWLNDFSPEYVAMPDNNLCPYGYAGDRLWVREKWRPVVNCKTGAELFDYYADMPEQFHAQHREYKWKPSIHMPRKAAQIFLEVINVRIERLQDITHEDAIAEGVETLGLYPGYEVSSRGKYEGLWNSINGNESWEQNPWVWVIEFKKIEA